MLKKIGVVTALSTALIFGGAFTTTANAQANADQPNVQYKVYYSVNGEKGSITDANIKELLSQDKLNNIVGKVMDRYNITLPQVNVGKQAEQKVELPVQKEQEAPAKQPVQVEQPKAPAKQPVQVEQPKAPAKQPVKVEEPKAPAKQPVQAEQPKAPTQQQPAQEKPAEQKAQNNNQNAALSQYEQEVVELTNQERAKYGLSALQIDTELSKVAREKSNDMASKGYFDHNSPTYGSPFDMMKSFGISYRTAGENIAMGQRTPAEVVDGWMNSEGHRANILNGEFTHIGVGYVENGNYWTQQFIGK
ncbi:hypothetical protein CWR48_06645 [Oceanobacillus arenosus]|uniref:SCP domain-containing protein n=1 Tax=Oceanobacillus arenosus TaxID=1229153 RepID=A0A3D8PWE5_9BACI|nr:CAP domain-containing protein [Oceanobacillus arenosus]RDW20354.1 hypothetical protein CWR48_06645 [Oceanobacillus arenosus]